MSSPPRPSTPGLGIPMEMTPGQIMEAEISATLLDDPSSPWVFVLTNLDIFKREKSKINYVLGEGGGGVMIKMKMMTLTIISISNDQFFSQLLPFNLHKINVDNHDNCVHQLLPSHPRQCVLSGFPCCPHHCIQVPFTTIHSIIITCPQCTFDMFNIIAPPIQLEHH